MIDFGFDKIALIGAVALIVIGPEKLPRVARTVGHLVGKAQRYVADVKAEVNRSIELEELKKMKTEFEDAARNVEQNVSREIHQTTTELEQSWHSEGSSTNTVAPLPTSSAQHVGWQPPPPVYRHPNKHWRLKRGAMPQWYKQRAGVRVKAQSGAARVARFRPPRSTAPSSSSAGRSPV
jgi:sec-independent protein translocase protein TatB